MAAIAGTIQREIKDDGENMTDSASEKDIIRNHVSIIVQMLDTYNEAMEFDYGEELQYPDIPNWKVVQELLLRGTTHAGKTSSIKNVKKWGLIHGRMLFLKEKRIKKHFLAAGHKGKMR